MSIIKINAITVPADSGDELGKRFAARRDSMEGTEGFEGFELLKPTDDRHTWLVITRWASEEAFENWRTSQDFQRSHSGGEAPAGEAPKKPVGMSAELWSYTTSVTG
ncbi:antibiotic biosynthesis monooxygenase [Nesterenkonia sp. AN1]|uniref:Heme-degrading monooxygenase HmoA n=1 Tax=Nesterenkonia aurantiaca TaxID=1436010 RepID=A0A4R7G4U0_9MICC|nr:MULTISPECIES: antibiotic biosynthesis monooxygenase family protein [Nesterenkonia]EXF24525.1 antibiotic biosynthesis monooxygenase [Nesterenkonia sp. AN1]TDS86170.1 heme-degrading monooxygenase HmoA [Nesterenkonia aurantiaca]